jgi:hypothetical protein
MTANDDDSQITGEELSRLSAYFRPDLPFGETARTVSAVLTKEGLDREAVASAMVTRAFVTLALKNEADPLPERSPPGSTATTRTVQLYHDYAMQSAREGKTQTPAPAATPALHRPGNGDLQ